LVLVGKGTAGMAVGKLGANSVDVPTDLYMASIQLGCVGIDARIS
jgi:hypothetical protein